MQLIIVLKDNLGNLGDKIKVTCRTGMGRDIVRPIQSLNESRGYNGKKRLENIGKYWKILDN